MTFMLHVRVIKMTEKAMENSFEDRKKWMTVLGLLTVLSFFYFSFIFLVGFNPELLGSCFPGSHLSLGLVWGSGLIFLSIIMNAYYVFHVAQKPHS